MCKLADGPVTLEADHSGGPNPVREDAIEGAYRRWRHQHAGDRWTVMVHRLAAVAWCYDAAEHDRPTDAVRGMEVHHRVPIRWLNTEANLETLEPADHAIETFHAEPADPEEVLA